MRIEKASMSVKDSLRLTIQTKRVARGLHELKIPKEEGKRVEKLSKYDEERRRLRRERNKEAANKCRRKKREKLELLEKIATELQQSNKSLESDIANMKEEVKELLAFLEQHECNISM